MMTRILPTIVCLALAAGPAMAQDRASAILVRVERGVESGFFDDTGDARRELAAKVEMAARMACADSWTPRTTIYESIDYQVDWESADRAHPRQRKAIARDISVRCASN